MYTPIVIDRNEILDLVATFPQGIRLSQLMEKVADRFGRSVTFHSGARIGMDLDALLVSLESREKVRIVRGVVYPGRAPACVS